MRRTFLLQPVFWAMVVMLISCQKGVEKQTDNTQLISKINSWLEKQKSPTQPNKAANIDLLKECVDFSALRFENLNAEETIIVVPLSDNYKMKRNIDKNTVTVLLLVKNNAGSIVRGNLVIYFPENNAQVKTIPDNTFSKMYSEKDLDCNGLFRFLSPTGRRLYEREYKNGKLHSFGYVRADNIYQGRTSTDCTYYYLILSFWVDGVVVAQEAIYLGSICQGVCDDPNNQTLCPDGGGGGGGSGGGDGNVDNFCINSAISEFQQEVNGAQVASQTESITISDINEITKNKNPKWRILKGWSGWNLESQEKGIIKLIDQTTNRWAWKSLEHGPISMVGTPTPGVDIEYNQGVGTPSFTPETAAATIVLYGGMSLNYNVTYRFMCNCPNLPIVNLIPPIIRSYTSGAIWDANPF